MNDLMIFVCGFCITFMVVAGTFLFTFVEFNRMGKNPDQYRRKSQADTDESPN
jgi:hypothetical protein